MNEMLVFGDTTIPVRLPDRTQVVPQEFTVPIEPVPDLDSTVREALEHPLDRPRLAEIARPGFRVTIAFDDPTVPCYAPVWPAAIGAVLGELARAGVSRSRVTLLCANALHRRFTRLELARILGDDLVRESGFRLVCHDAEDRENLVDLGRTSSGAEVELNRLVADSDLTVYVNVTCWRGFNGGWKSIAVGLSSYRSIRWHHGPDGMSMSTTGNVMHRMLDEMGLVIQAKIGAERIFKIETVLANPFQVGRMWAGSVGATRRAALDLVSRHTTARRDLLAEKADIVCYGVPEWSPYAAFASMNPILTLLSTGLGYLGGVIEAVGKPGCSVVLATPCPDEWDEVHHPSYREIWERVLPVTRDPYEIRDRFEDDFAHRPEYIYRYRYCHGFHPVHGIMATFPLKRLRHAGKVFVAGARKPALVEHLGFEPAPTVEDALARAEALHGGAKATIALVRYPPAFNRR